MNFTSCVIMILQACVIFGYFSTVNTQSTQPSLIQSCFGDVCYIRPDPSSGRNWPEAQKRCKEFNSTLPIVEKPEHHRSFEAAVRNLTNDAERNTGIWIGAKAFTSQPANWTWLNGSIYSEKDVQSQGAYYKSYAYVSKTSEGVLAHASPPNASYSYICYYPTPTDVCRNDTRQTFFYIEERCYVKYDAQFSWFSARNNCLSNNGDLASFTQLFLLGGIIDSNRSWVGLRHSQWMWQNAVTGLSSDVTFTLWKLGQPNDADANCISTDTYEHFPSWRDWDCARVLPFICQVNATMASTPAPTSATPSTSSTTPKITTISHNLTDPIPGSVNIALAVGLGVGIGAPVIILIVVAIVLIIVRRKHQSSTVSGNSQSISKFASKNSQNNSETETSEMSENCGTRLDNNSSAQYATIRGAMGLDQDANLVLPSNHGTVYAPLSFNQASC